MIKFDNVYPIWIETNNQQFCSESRLKQKLISAQNAPFDVIWFGKYCIKEFTAYQ